MDESQFHELVAKHVESVLDPKTAALYRRKAASACPTALFEKLVGKRKGEPINHAAKKPRTASPSDSDSDSDEEPPKKSVSHLTMCARHEEHAYTSRGDRAVQTCFELCQCRLANLLHSFFSRITRVLYSSWEQK